ncbi:MAG: ankyrin repeat domain-containing protein [Fimbriiglobus sp.]|jgi:ankyrin repeat protein|nr:ankyrin repeat domain-containing protein [Fimbriiglobus sp.]
MAVTPLEVACYKAEVKKVRDLLTAGAAVTFDALRNTVNFHSKGEAKKRLEILKLLLDAGADPNTPPEDEGASVLQVAAASESTEILRMLIAAGGRVDTGCLVHAAIDWNHPENIRVLVAAGADPNEPLTSTTLPPDSPELGMTPLQYARHLKHRKCVAVLTELLGG